MGFGVSAISRAPHAAPRRTKRVSRTKATIFASLLPLLVVSAQAAAQQRPATFVDAATVVPGLIVDMRYAGAHNFVGRPIDGYAAPRCLLTRPAAEALAAVAGDLKPHGLVLKVFDCYRPTRAVADFARWAHDPKNQKMKAEFYPEVDKRTLFRDGYIASHSGHSRGSTMDLTLANADGRELDMGTPFDFFSLKSWPGNPAVGDKDYANRSTLAEVMAKHGFRPYNREWWHFTLRHEPFPQTYFDFVVK